MTEDTDTLERKLATDLATLEDLLVDEDFCIELYRGLANVAWFREEGGGHVALSWTLAERLVNDLRRDAGRDPVAPLAQTGGEGRVARRVDEQLAKLGWHHRPVDTSEHDDRHVGEPRESPPPPDAGLKKAPRGATTEEERFRSAHEEAQANRLSHG
jgi:hypothetical protein